MKIYKNTKFVILMRRWRDFWIVKKKPKRLKLGILKRNHHLNSLIQAFSKQVTKQNNYIRKHETELSNYCICPNVINVLKTLGKLIYIFC